MKKLILLLCISLSINASAQNVFLENDKGSVLENNTLKLIQFSQGKDPEINAYKMLHNAGFKARQNYSFSCKGKQYEVLYIKSKKIYSFMGLETKSKKDMVAYLALITKKLKLGLKINSL